MVKGRRASSLRNRLKSSSIRSAYWAVAKKSEFAARKREEGFYRETLVGLRRGDVVFDIGANEGSKADVFMRLGARVIAMEPDSACARILRDRFLRYRFTPMPITIVGKAVSDQVGVSELFEDGPASAINTMSRKWADHLKEHKESFRYGHFGLDFSRRKLVETTTIDSLMDQYGQPFFVKIDVEGHELNVIRGMQRPVPFLSFEVNLPVFKNEGIECIRALHKLDPNSKFNYTPDCCAGLALKEWVNADEMSPLVGSCSDDSIEVFWRSTSAAARSDSGNQRSA